MPKLYIVVFTGDRNWSDPEPVRRKIRELKSKLVSREELLIVVGGAPGLDQLAEIVAHEENVHTARVAALWDTRRKAAGPQRNAIMLALNPNEVVAFHNDFKRSRGTKNCVMQAELASITVDRSEAR